MLINKYTLTPQKSIEKRDILIWGSYDPNAYADLNSMRRYTKLDVVKIEELVKRGYIDLRDHPNLQPENWELINFIKEFPQYTAFGFAVWGYMCIQGLEKDGFFESQRERESFFEISKWAMEYLITNRKVYCKY